MSRRAALHDRFLAWFMARGGKGYARFMETRKRELLGSLTGILVEIGSGTGPNLRFLPDGVRVVGVEPNPFMHRYFLDQARSEGRAVELVQGVAERLPFPDESVDAVVSTLVLCSVTEVDRTLAEVLRVLKPGGQFLFVEHVAAGEGTWLRRLQRWVRPLWRAVGDGCEPDRVTGLHLRRAGFKKLTLEAFSAPLPLVSPHIAGIAEK